MKVEYPRFDEMGWAYCDDCPFNKQAGLNCCKPSNLRCPTSTTYAEACRIAEGRAAEEKPAAAPLALTPWDHFAGMALQGLIIKTGEATPTSYIVNQACGYADAMMEARGPK